MLFYRAALPLSRKTLTFVSGIIRRHRISIGSPWRKLNCSHPGVGETTVYGRESWAS